MHAAIKLLFGIVLIAIGLWLLIPVGTPVIGALKPGTWSMLDWWEEFLTVVKGLIPPVVIILGILVVWIESEELKSPVIPEESKEESKNEK